MTHPWIVRHSTGWCALPDGRKPDPHAVSDETLCAHFVAFRWDARRGQPDCPECLAKLAASRRQRVTTP
jgi:hypothetical protein